MKETFFTVLVFPSHKEPVMRPDFDQSYLKKLFEFFKTVESNLKLVKTLYNKISLQKTWYLPMALNYSNLKFIHLCDLFFYQYPNFL